MSEIELLRQNAVLEEHVVELKTKLEWTEKLFGILWAHCSEGGTPAELVKMSENGVAVMGWVVEAGQRCADTHYPQKTDE
ncbi:MAG TPA: hypothetical protein VGB45_07190 [Abditibacterium sp.]|jgi:hypothetical protein